jgi:hypothetical protein
VRRAEFFRHGKKRSLMKGKRWLLLTRWVNLSSRKKQGRSAGIRESSLNCLGSGC